eukprot:12150050-Alexandrium_andersonii.AAC.1
MPTSGFDQGCPLAAWPTPWPPGPSWRKSVPSCAPPAHVLSWLPTLMMSHWSSRPVMLPGSGRPSPGRGRLL